MDADRAEVGAGCPGPSCGAPLRVAWTGRSPVPTFTTGGAGKDAPDTAGLEASATLRDAGEDAPDTAGLEASATLFMPRSTALRASAISAEVMTPILPRASWRSSEGA